MIPPNIRKEHITKAICEIDSNGIPPGRESRKFHLTFEGNQYPPKYVLSIANRFANDKELNPSEFSGGQEANSFLSTLGFKIVESSSSGTFVKSTSSQTKSFEAIQKGHDERCPECKNTVERMLRKIYGDVKNNYKFEVSTNINDYKAISFYSELREIFLNLQKHRGYKEFIRTPTLPHCDFFVPNPGFIVEFDESQHFTLPRKISLRNYPQNLKLGFPPVKWIALCESINAKDNDPPFRDEQRAWYDTLRDFLPELKGFKPTVRLYYKEMKWCGLSLEKPEDVARFRQIIQNGQKGISDWVATVVIQSNESYSNDNRLEVLSQVVELVADKTQGDGVILFPGGWFSAGKREARSLYEWVTEQVGGILIKKNRGIIACVGIDGRETSEWSKDQIGAAISKEGIIALGRKFHPAPTEKKYVDLANNHLEKEENHSRVFELKGRKYFICACYDSFGIKQKGIPNFGIDVILDLVHGFYPRGEGGSGDVYFAKHGFAGASKEWRCLTFGAAVFFNRRIPERWPSGVYWNQGIKSTQKWRYEDNPIKPQIEEVRIEEGIASVRLYNLEVI